MPRSLSISLAVVPREFAILLTLWPCECKSFAWAATESLTVSLCELSVAAVLDVFGWVFADRFDALGKVYDAVQGLMKARPQPSKPPASRVTTAAS